MSWSLSLFSQPKSGIVATVAALTSESSAIHGDVSDAQFSGQLAALQGAIAGLVAGLSGSAENVSLICRGRGDSAASNAPAFTSGGSLTIQIFEQY